uniref:RNA-directed DNA polymerase n=2 Tax=Lygus hesperus TaxID=30085 RepID=A0A0A9XMS0_LYGHE
MVTFYLKYIPKAADILAPLHELTRKNEKWRWTDHCERSFNQIKKQLISPPVLTHFMPELPIYLKVDASKRAISAILSHCFPDNTEKPLAFASRVLANPERKYPQIEREGLALVYGVLKFHEYIYGNPNVVLWTDHKPLTAIFREKKGIPLYSANRLQRWAHILSPYMYNLKFVSSEENAADYLSRYTEETGNADIVDPFQAVSYIHFIQENSPIVPNWNTMKAATSNDPTLSIVYRRILHDGWPDKEDEENVKPYFSRRHELTVDQGCVMWGHRLVIPPSLRTDLLKLPHECHFGSSKMKSLARNYFWWPNLDSDIEKMAANCEKCQQYRANPPKTPQKWAVPSKPWTRLHLDFFGPINSTHYLIVCDASSKWIECFPAKTTSSAVVIEHLKSLFARFGLPKTIATDNATCFKSEEFQHFLSKFKILHVTGAPYHPETNGLAENGVRTLKNFLKKENLMDKDSKIVMQEMEKFLFMYRNTPHSTTNETPAKMIFGRPLRTHLSLLFPSSQEQKPTKNLIPLSKEPRLANLKLGDTVLARDYRPRHPHWTRGQVTHHGFGKVTVSIEGGTEVERHRDQLLPVVDQVENPIAGGLPRSPPFLGFDEKSEMEQKGNENTGNQQVSQVAQKPRLSPEQTPQQLVKTGASGSKLTNTGKTQPKSLLLGLRKTQGAKSSSSSSTVSTSSRQLRPRNPPK